MHLHSFPFPIPVNTDRSHSFTFLNFLQKYTTLLEEKKLKRQQTNKHKDKMNERKKGKKRRNYLEHKKTLQSYEIWRL